MQRSQRRVLIAAFTVLFVVVFLYTLRSGPDPKTGNCVDAQGRLVGCGERSAIYKLVRKVGSGRECPAAAAKVYAFERSLFCGAALPGVVVPSGEYVQCLLTAGADLALGPADLAFARGFAAPARSASSAVTGRVKIRGDDWRIFYVLHERQADPGLVAVVANPAVVSTAAYITQAAAHRKEVAAATRCADDAGPAT